MKKLGHYNLIQTDAGWHSTLCAGNNKVILTSVDSYSESTQVSALIYLTNAEIHSLNIVIGRKESQDKKYYFCLNRIKDCKWISETYNTKQSMERGIKSVLANTKTTDVRIVDRRTKK